MTDKRVAELLADIAQVQTAHHQIMQSVREEVKYGGILFSCAQPFCGLFAYTQHVTLELGEGAHLPDDFQVLEGS